MNLKRNTVAAPGFTTTEIELMARPFTEARDRIDSLGTTNLKDEQSDMIQTLKSIEEQMSNMTLNRLKGAIRR